VRYAAFLRAVNLGKNRRVTNDRLRELFEGAGAEEVAPFRTSGNVVFEASRDMARRLEKDLEEALGHDMVIFLRTEAEVKEIAAAEPFAAREVERSKGKLQVVLFEKNPTAAVRKKALALATDRDRLTFGKRELFWLPSGGYMEAELDRRALDELVGPTTVRTKGTVDALVAKYFAA
jgi:uncharacterized protein (DUF1697 family)